MPGRSSMAAGAKDAVLRTPRPAMEPDVAGSGGMGLPADRCRLLQDLTTLQQRDRLTMLFSVQSVARC